MLIYWKQVAAVAVALALLAAGIWLRGIVAENAMLRRDIATAEARAKELERAVTLANDFTSAIQSIRIRNTVNVARIESEPRPAAAHTLVRGGVLHSVYTSASAPGGAPSPP